MSWQANLPMARNPHSGLWELEVADVFNLETVALALRNDTLAAATAFASSPASQ